jgi:hypothetical protein
MLWDCLICSSASNVFLTVRHPGCLSYDTSIPLLFPKFEKRTELLDFMDTSAMMSRGLSSITGTCISSYTSSGLFELFSASRFNFFWSQLELVWLPKLFKTDSRMDCIFIIFYLKIKLVFMDSIGSRFSRYRGWHRNHFCLCFSICFRHGRTFLKRPLLSVLLLSLFESKCELS